MCSCTASLSTLKCHMISWHDTTIYGIYGWQRLFSNKVYWALKDCNLCILIWANQEANVPYNHNTSSLPHFQWKVFVMIVFGMMNIYKEYIKNEKKKITLAHIFAYNSQSILPQSASFSHALTQIAYCVGIYYEWLIYCVVGVVGIYTTKRQCAYLTHLCYTLPTAYLT